MPDLIKLLERFNRKERYFLIRQTLALREGKFQLSDEFRKKLGCKIGLDVDIPCDAFVAMDYHLDWVAASLRDYQKCIPMDKILCEVFSNPDDNKMVTGTQQDIDLLIAFEEGECYHLILLEAKGYASWDSKQMRKKLKHVNEIFTEGKATYPNVVPHLVLMSRGRPRKSTTDAWTDKWPKWMREEDNGRPHWLKLCLPSDRHMVTRYDPDKEKSSKEGKFFKIVKA